MKRISDLVLNTTDILTLVVTGATPRLTKAKKPYLSLELFDGVDKISGNYWDWSGVNVPELNSILDVTATASLWNDTKQLTITKLSRCQDPNVTLEDFSPSSGLDVEEIYIDACEVARSISDEFYRTLCLDVLETLADLWKSVPAAITVHHDYVAGTLIHSVTTAKTARAISKQIPESNCCLVTAGALLHDIGKLFGYKLDGVVCAMTDEGKLFEHMFIGAEFINNFAEDRGIINCKSAEDKLDFLKHIILSHPGKQEYGAVIQPAMLEAHIVYHADSVDSIAEMIRTANKNLVDKKWTDKIWALGNKPHLSLDYVKAALAQ